MEIDTKILTRRSAGKYTADKGKAGPGHRTIDGSFASYRKVTRMSGFRGCGALGRRLKGISMRPAQSLTVERLESRCVLSAMGPDLPRLATPLRAETNVAPLPAIAAPPAEIVTRAAHHDDYFADHSPVNPLPSGRLPEYMAQPSSPGFNSAPSGYWAPEPVVTYVFAEFSNSIHGSAPSFGYNDGFYDIPSRPEYRPPSGSKQMPLVPLEGASAATTPGTDSSAKVSEHTNLSEALTQSSSQSAAISRVGTSATNQTAYPVAPLTVRTATLTPTPAATELLEFVLGKCSAANAAKLAGDPSQAAIAWATSAAQFVQASAVNLPGSDLIADLVRGLPRLAEMPLPSVQQAIETVMADIKLIGTEVSQWLEGIHFTPMVLAVTAATAGAGTAAYLRRRGGREARDRDDEASSSWLFARLQPIPLEV